MNQICCDHTRLICSYLTKFSLNKEEKGGNYMHKYILKRLLMLIPVILGVTFIVFFILNLSPGDPAAMILGEQATAEALEMKREELGLNDPLLVRYFNYMKDLLRGDMGVSYRNSISVWDQVIDRFPNTVVLAIAGILVALLIGIPLGILSAKKQNTVIDNISMAALSGYGRGLRSPAAESGSARADPGYRLGGYHRPHDPLVHAGGNPAGLYLHRPLQGCG